MTTIKYKILFNGQYVTETGDTTDFLEQAATFENVTAAEALIEASGAAGEYRVMTVIEKS